MDLPQPEHLHTTEQAAIALHVPSALIRKWAHREQIRPAGHLPAAAPGGRLPLYYLNELQPLVERYHARSGPTLIDGVLTARCTCGSPRRLPVAAVPDSDPCENCGATTADGLLHGPDNRSLQLLMMRDRPPSDVDNVVYFARVGNLVKIGTTGNVWQRMAALGHPQLLGVIDGGYKVEKQHHRRFADEHVTGEIFQATDRLLSYIAKHCTRPIPPDKSDPQPVPDIPRWAWDL